MTDFTTFLKDNLPENLPGAAAQLKMAPQHNSDDRFDIPCGVRHNGVLILLHHSRNNPHIIFTLRSANLLDHSGQICYPGGSSEPHETLQEAALRELREEIGIELTPEQIIGKLTPLYVPPSGNLIHPFIAFRETLPPLKLQPDEVSEAFPIALEDLISPKNKTSELWNYKGKSIEVPYWTLHSVPLWGATAMITSELTELYKQYRNIA